MKAKRILSVLSAAALSFSLCIPLAGAASFPDIEGHEAEAAINLFADLGILKGDETGNFHPDRTITRSEMCAILNRVFSYTERAENTFPDLDETKWYADDMLRLNAQGIVLGDDKGNINPLTTIRWDEALTMISRAFGLPVDPELSLAYEVPQWAHGYIAPMSEAGYLPGGEIDPAAPFTRADTVIVLNNIIDDLGWQSTGKLYILKKLVPIIDGVAVSTYDRSAFYSENGRIYYDDGVIVPTYGIDVSNHQKEIDWTAVAGDGIDFAIIRTGFRGYGTAGTINLDSYFHQNMEGALAAGLDVGVYFFSQAISVEEAIEEANFVLEQLEGYELTYPVIYDWENISTTSARTQGLDSATLNACAVAFCETVAAAGYQPMVYFNGYLGLLRYDVSAIDDYPFWYAVYGRSTPNMYYDFQMWQYSDSGSVAGIEGRVDMDICFGYYGQPHTGGEPSENPGENAETGTEGNPEETPENGSDENAVPSTDDTVQN